jgi:hypothetical protein
MHRRYERDGGVAPSKRTENLGDWPSRPRQVKPQASLLRRDSGQQESRFSERCEILWVEIAPQLPLAPLVCKLARDSLHRIEHNGCVSHNNDLRLLK